MADNTDNINNTDDNQYLENLEFILNTYVIYYKKTFPDEKLNSFFDNINNYDDTNKMMEHFYHCIQDYKASKMKKSIEYDEDKLEEIEEKYILVVNDVNKYMSDNIISLLIDVINNDFNNWNIIDI
jgi:hypothetical protein